MAKAKTIQIFLPDGNPRGTKIAEITNRTVQVILIPRADLKAALARPELKNIGVYFLVGDSEDDSKPLVYVGQSEDCIIRLDNHNREKDFWQYVLVAISKTKFFTKSHVEYLEWYSIEKAKQANRYKLENNNGRTENYVSESVKADLQDNYEDIKTLVSTLGHKIFDELENPSDSDILYCNGKGTCGKGEYTEDGFVVFKGSKCRLDPVPSYSERLTTYRSRLISEGIMEKRDDCYIFTDNCIFKSPSTAAEILLGSSANGWDAWKYKDGRTLDEVKRQG